MKYGLLACAIWVLGLGIIQAAYYPRTDGIIGNLICTSFISFAAGQGFRLSAPNWNRVAVASIILIPGSVAALLVYIAFRVS